MAPHPRARSVDESRNHEDAARPPLPPSHDPDWRERIEQARSAREDGRKAREGKQIVFPTVGSRPPA